MKLSTTASSICLAAAASAPSRFANAAVCGELISKLETLRLAAVAAKTAYEEKSIELDACQVSTPAPIPPTPAPTLPPILSSILLRTPAPMVPLTPAPVLPPTPWPTLPATPGPTAAAADDDDDGRFQIVKGQSWNYNLDTPVNIEDVDVDIYFIDMGECCCCCCCCRLCSSCCTCVVYVCRRPCGCYQSAILVHTRARKG